MKTKQLKLLAAALCLTVLAACGNTAQPPAQTQQPDAERDAVVTRVASLKGPTSMGLVKMMDDADAAEQSAYSFEMFTAADEIVPLIAKGEIDIALVPTNLAATLYQKIEGGVAAININAGNVLYGVASTEETLTTADLKGRTIFMTGKGTTPEWTLRYLLGKGGIAESDVQLEFKTEAAEVISALAQNPDAVGILPQPFVTSALMQNENLHIVYNINDEWTAYSDPAVQGGTVTGVTIVRRDFLQEHPEAVARFNENQKASVAYVSENPEQGAALIEKYGIVKAGVAQKVLADYNPTLAETGSQAKAWLEEYLTQLFEISPEAVGGKLPDEGFYELG